MSSAAAPVCSASWCAASGRVERRGAVGGLAGRRARLEAEDLLDPGRQRIGGEGCEYSAGGRSPSTRRRSASVSGDRRRIGDPLQRLADDLAGLDGHTEQRRRHLGDRPPLVVARRPRSSSSPRCRCTGRQARRRSPAAGGQAAPRRRPGGRGRCAARRGPGTASPAAASTRPAIPRPGQDKLEHHVVGEQDVGRISDDPRPVLRRLLAGVPGETHRRTARVTDRQELLQLPQLAVGQGVHRIDHDRLDAGPVSPRRLRGQDPVDDRDDVRQALSRPGARSSARSCRQCARPR